MELIWGVIGVARWQNKFKYWDSAAFRFHAILSSPPLCRSTPFWAGKLKWSQTLGTRLLWSYRNTGKQAHIGNRRSNSVINPSFPGPSINCSMISLWMRWLFICLSVCKIELLRQAIYDSTVMFFILVCVYLKTVSLCAFPAILFIYFFFFFWSLCVLSLYPDGKSLGMWVKSITLSWIYSV